MLTHPIGAQPVRVDSSFSWSGQPGAHASLVIKNLSGDIRVRGSGTDRIEVRAVKSWRRGDPTLVRIEVSHVGTDGDTALLCGWWQGATLSCDVGGYIVNNDGGNDTRVDFDVLIPRTMRVSVATIGGSVHLEGLESEIRASTITGTATVAFATAPDAELFLSSVSGTFRNDFDPPARTRLRRGSTRIRLGLGGQRIYLSTVSGRLHLARD